MKDMSDEFIREKLLSKGVGELSDAELISIVLRSGVGTESAISLSARLLEHYNNSLAELGMESISRLRMFRGMGITRAAVLASSLELSKRRQLQETMAIEHFGSRDDVIAHFKPMISELPYEEFWALYLGASNRLLDKVKISQGGVTGTVVDVRLIIKRALDKLASSIIIVHNHPSGNCRPSAADKTITENIRQAASFFDIALADHVIITAGESFSFRGENLL